MFMRVRMKWVVLWSLWAARLARQPTPAVRARGGLLRGELAPDGSHARYLGIPYATVHPENKYTAPGPEPTWYGTFEAVNEHVRCVQRLDQRLDVFLGQEDCLTLNVYTPLNTSPDAALPVMAFIHGGAFVEGSGSPGLYGPRHFTSKGVILVTINYRLNLPGFLCLPIKEAPGNAAMKDQVAAFRWIQRNIRAFGGNPDSVTIFGESAGGASVSYHLLSPMSKGLFHKAIMMSGSALSPWAHGYDAIDVISAVAKAMGYHTKDPHELYDIFVKKSDVEAIRPRVPRDRGGSIYTEMLASPCVETVFEDVEAFLTEDPYKLLLEGRFQRMPVMIGVNDEEGYHLAGYENDTTLSNFDFNVAMPRNLRFPSENDRMKAACEVKEMYMGNDTVSRESIVKLSRFHGEPFLTYPSLAETLLILNSSDQPVFNYLFKYDGWKNIAKFASGVDLMSAPGASHADELFYLFTQHNIFSMFEWRMVDKITTLWTNFAKHGDPTPDVPEGPARWRRTSREDPRAFVIDREYSNSSIWFRPSLRYWHQLYSKYRRTYA